MNRKLTRWQMLDEAREEVATLTAQLAESNRLLAELKETQRWIPVSERLPEYGQVVLIWHKDWRPAVVSWHILATVGLIGTIPTHWMPLPPPTGEG